MDVTLEPEALDHIVHAIEAAQNGALAAPRGADKAGYRPLWDRNAAVAHGEEVSVKNFTEVAVDRYFRGRRRWRGRVGDAGLGSKHDLTSRVSRSSIVLRRGSEC